MLDSKISRRRMMQLGVGAATAGVVPVSKPLAYASGLSAVNRDSDLPGGPQLQHSTNAAYAFLRQMMDAYAQGSTVRMCQSYCDQIAGGTFFSTAFTYDNALLALAFLARGRSDDIARAMIIGNALLYAQQTDPARDGRLRQAYMAGTPDSHGVFVTPGLSFFQGSAVGDVAWAGIALAQLYARTRMQTYLEGALRAATFIETTTRDNTNVPPGGYFFGNGQTNKSTEHNIDVYALFTMLAQLSGDNSWLDGATHARAFVEAMFDAPSGHFWTGTSDPTNIFFNNSPEDVQTWSYLAFQDPNFAITLDWVKTNLATTDTTFAFNNGWGVNGSLRLRVSGMTYASLSKLGTVLGDNTVDADAVWLEGTGHSRCCTTRKRAGCTKQPGRRADSEWPATRCRPGHHGRNEHPEHRLWFQLFSIPSHRCDLLVCDGRASGKSATTYAFFSRLLIAALASGLIDGEHTLRSQW